MSSSHIQHLARDESGHLTLVLSDGSIYTHVQAVRAHPLSAPDEGISLMSADGHEVAWIDRLSTMPTALRETLNQELAARELMPRIEHIERVSSFATPCTWHVQTDRGATQFLLKSEDMIRRLPDGRLLIQSADGLQFVIAQPHTLQPSAQALLHRFL